jgi:O-antigen ligase
MQSHATQQLREWVLSRSRYTQAILVGLAAGAIGGLAGLLIALLSPLIAIVLIAAALLALYVLTDVKPALYGAMGTMILLPFGTFPFKIGLTPTLLDLALGAFLLVYLIQWITGKRRKIELAPPHIFIALYTMWLIFAFMLGLRYGTPTSTILRQFAEALLAISLSFIIVDLLQDKAALRSLVLIIMALIMLQACLAILLYVMPDTLAENLLVRLARIGYPNGGVIRYIESTPELGERAIGTWVDPNALGGLLAVGAAMITPQLLSSRPVFRQRWITGLVLAIVGLALLLTSSRASFLAYAISLTVLIFLRYRQFIAPLLIGALLFLILPQTQGYLDRVFQALRGEDLATQMRIGEWTDSLELIQRYPLTGIGFTGTPTRDVYTDVANMYLIMANQIGLTGVALFLIAMASVFYYAFQSWKQAAITADLEAIHLGYHLALLTALINAFADLYYFRLDFQSSITWFWLIVALSITSSRLALSQKSTVDLSG